MSSDVEKSFEKRSSNSSNNNQSITSTDGNIISEVLKNLDANSYATKKTIAQGLLDVALLTANASQLKYILQVGERHDFYTLMLSLIITSIILQLIQVVICIFLGSQLDINKQEEQDKASNANNGILAINALLVAVNVLISTFEMKENFADDSTREATTETLLKT